MDHDSDEDIYDIHDSDDEYDDDEEDEIDEDKLEDTVSDCRCEGFVIDDMIEVIEFPRVTSTDEIHPIRDNQNCQDGDMDPEIPDTRDYAGSVINQLLHGRLSHMMQLTPDGGMKDQGEYFAKF